MKNQIAASFTILFLACAAPAHATGFDVGNGGDTVLCHPSNENGFNGYYSLDYLLTLQSDNSDIETPKTWAQSRDRIQSVFDKNDSDFGILFREYIAKVPGEAELPPDYRWIQDRIWEESPYGLVDIKDEQMIRQLPENCRNLKEDSQLELIQTVIRNRKPTVTFYSYDPKILAELKQTNPLQYSFLIVHEWLWDFIDDPNTLRRINRFIHSNAFANLNQVELRKALTNLGLSLTYGTPMPMCERSADFQTLLVHAAGKSCELIDPNTFTGSPANKTIDGKNMGLSRLLPGDFSGMPVVYRLDLSGNQLSTWLEHTFTGLTSVTELSLDNNGIQSLPDGIFSGLPVLKTLSLQGNQFTEFPMAITNLFHQHGGGYNLLYIELNQNQIATIPGEFLVQACNYVEQFPSDSYSLGTRVDINLSGNPLPAITNFDQAQAACSQRKHGSVRWIVDDNMRAAPGAHDIFLKLAVSGTVVCMNHQSAEYQSCL